MNYEERKTYIAEAAKRMNKRVYQEDGLSKNVAPRTDGLTNSHKVVSLERTTTLCKIETDIGHRSYRGKTRNDHTSVCG